MTDEHEQSTVNTDAQETTPFVNDNTEQYYQINWNSFGWALFMVFCGSFFYFFTSEDPNKKQFDGFQLFKQICVVMVNGVANLFFAYGATEYAKKLAKEKKYCELFLQFAYSLILSTARALIMNYTMNNLVGWKQDLKYPSVVATGLSEIPFNIFANRLMYLFLLKLKNNQGHRLALQVKKYCGFDVSTEEKHVEFYLLKLHQINATQKKLEFATPHELRQDIELVVNPQKDISLKKLIIPLQILTAAGVVYTAIVSYATSTQKSIQDCLTKLPASAAAVLSNFLFSTLYILNCNAGFSVVANTAETIGALYTQHALPNSAKLGPLGAKSNFAMLPLAVICYFSTESTLQLLRQNYAGSFADPLVYLEATTLLIKILVTTFNFYFANEAFTQMRIHSIALPSYRGNEKKISDIAFLKQIAKLNEEENKIRLMHPRELKEMFAQTIV